MPKRSRPPIPPAWAEPHPDPTELLFTARDEGIGVVVTVKGLGEVKISRGHAFSLIGQLSDAIEWASGINPRSGEPV